MAQASAEIDNVRRAVTQLLNTTIPQLAGAMALIDGSGPTDTERLIFFTDGLAAASGNDDIDITDFENSVIAIRAIQTAFDNNLEALYKLRK